MGRQISRQFARDFARPIVAVDSDIIFNFRPGLTGNLPNFSAAKIAGGHIPVGFWGDSLVMGNNAGGTGFTGAAALRITEDIATQVRDGGLNVQTQSIFSSNGVSTYAQQIAYDPRMVSASPDWNLHTDVVPWGNAWRCLNGSTTPQTWTFAGIADKATVWYIRRSANQDTMVVKDGATTIGTQSTVGGATGTIMSVTFDLDGRAAGKTISVARTNTVAQPIVIVGISVWDSQSPGLHFHNFGRSGTEATQEWSSTISPWSAGNDGLTMMNMKLGLINLLTNDLDDNRTPAAVKTSVGNLIDKQRAGDGGTNDAGIIIPHRGGPIYGSTPEQDAMHEAMRELALEKDCPLINHAALFGSYANSVANGYLADTVHPNPTGNAVLAMPIAQMLLAA